MTHPSVAIVGAGPQALALVLTLLDRDPAWRDRVTAIDPSGTWLSQWRTRFRHHRIDRLRSAGVHHPHPDPTSLRAHARRCDRLVELHAPYDQPGTELFDHYCDRLLLEASLAPMVRPDEVAEVVPLPHRALVVLRGGTALEVDRAVLATNPLRRRLPAEAEGADRPWRHADDIDLTDETDLAGARIDVVGGGLTAVQLAVGAAGQGARVRLLSRRPLVERAFDVHPGWLGPRHLDDYRRRDHRARRQLIDRARGGGSVPVHDLTRLRRSDVRHLVDDAAPTTALGGDADEVWFATGHQLDAAADPLLAQLRQRVPTEIHDGLPALDRDLAWPGTTVHLMGGYAALTLGPAARNLWGARQGADRIATTLAGSDAATS